MADYVHPEMLVETDWVRDNLGKPGIKLVEIDVDTKAYDAGHIAGAIGFNWQTQLQDQVRRDIISKDEFELAYPRALELCRVEGLLAAPAAGLICEGAQRIIKRDKTGLGVMIFPDGVFKYTANMAKHIPELAEGTEA